MFHFVSRALCAAFFLGATATEAVAAGSTPALAPAGGESVRVTLAEALSRGAEHNRQILAGRADLAGAEASLRGAQAPVLPAVSVGTSISNSLQPPVDTRTTGIAPQLMLSYDLGTDGMRSAQIEMTRAQTDVARREQERVVAQALLDISYAYFDLQSATAQVRIASASAGFARTGVDSAEALVGAQIATVFDVQRARSQYTNALQEYTSALGQERTASQALARLLGWPVTIRVTAADPVKVAGEWPHSHEESLELALARRPEMAQQRAQIRAAEWQVEAAHAARRIRTQLQVTGILGTNLTAPSVTETVFNGAFSLGYSAGANLSMPLYDNGASSETERRAAEALAAARLRAEDSEAALAGQVDQAFNLLVASRQNIDTAAVALEGAQGGLTTARYRFQAGMGSQTEVIDAQNDLRRAENNRLKAILDFNRALAGLRSLTLEP